MAQHSRGLYPDWIERLAAAWGRPIELRSSRLLCLADEEKEHGRLVDEVLPSSASAPSPLSRSCGREPLLGSAITRGL
ncbi:hypothetical protein [Actinomadura bangladeshensis]|uniref:Uncharacterized protein n=1 Tax=Actinomadura bangladeshensis TaxID=453573 RepID=A0A4R4P7T7_9ACTN|nr:hypothetical protein [Actinomadura bangladeshensis]TDC18225.1 hypothetical protein E1284_07100 [Actinomadura bangladeshensis]